MSDYKIAVLVPCYNEEVSISAVVNSFKSELPNADIYVFDNNSTDNTYSMAKKAGAIVVKAPYQGKGNVVRAMFSQIEADIYVLVDGDATYDAPSCHQMISLLIEGGLDMVVGCRKHAETAAYRTGHVFGNRMLTLAVSTIFGRSFTDLLSGYRIFSRRFAKSFPCLSEGFEIETEMSVHALQLRLPVDEVLTPYYSRMDNSVSKLNTYRDGIRILLTIINLFLFEKPKVFFSIIAGLIQILALILAVPIVYEWLQTGLVPRFPTAILCSGMTLMAVFLLFFGILLDASKRNRRNTTYLHYLQYKQFS